MRTVQVDRKELVTVLSSAKRAIGRPSQGILNNVLLTYDNSRALLSVSYTNLDSYYTVTVPIDSINQGESFGVLCDWKLLLEAIKSCDPKVLLMLDTDKLTVTDGKISSEIRLESRIEDYPARPTMDSHDVLVTVGAYELSNAIAQASPCISKDDLRPTLQGYYLELTDKCLVSCDIHRLAKIQLDTLTIEANDNKAKLTGWIIPSQALDELRQLLKLANNCTINIAYDSKSNKLQLATDNGITVINTKLIGGNYPNYKPTIDTKGYFKTVFDRKGLEGIFRKVGNVNKANAYRIWLTFGKDQQLLISSGRDVNNGSNTQTKVGFSCKLNEDIKFSANGHYLAQALSVATTELVTFEFKDDLSPFYITDKEHYLTLIMPIRD